MIQMVMEYQAPPAMQMRAADRLARLLCSIGLMTSTAVQVISLWSLRRRRRLALSELDEHLLRDIGASRQDIGVNRRVACGQSFWR
jgi:uncharacterized protein YjiS (DUF1127 family)